ncbi:MAG: penicillin acylase family protein [Acetobacteraceae bacterium]
MRSVLRWSRRLGLGVALMVVLLIAALVAAFRATVPPPRNEVAIAGLSAPVEIALDPHGIPWIRAQSAEDAYAALGYVHARDRLFQMEMMRRGASGRLAELIGAPGLRLDRFSRLLGLERKAEADLEALPADTRAALAAYARGVNAWIDQHGLASAPEFLLLGVRPQPWRETDSLLWGKAMALFLTGNMRTELARLALSGRLPRERIDELWPRDTSLGTPLAAASSPAATPALSDHAARLLAGLPRFGEDAPHPPAASNIWAVTGSRSATGRPLLANDPHLALVTPGPFQLARVEAPGLSLAGGFAPGVPFLMLGHNGHVAWGFTTTHSDTQDVFIERLVDADRYLTPEGPRPFTVREERIAVRFGEDVVLRVRETRNGPVLSDLDGVARAPEGHVLAVRMALLEPGDAAATAMHRLNRARDLEEAEAALRLIAAPQQNIVVADRAGRIGMFLPARIPLRRAGDGSFPVPGWDGSHDWTGFAPYEALPRFVDPPTERLVNANNRVVPDDFPVWLTRDWWGDFRFRRIVERLDSHGRPHDLSSMAAIQLDIVSAAARELLPLLLRSEPRSALGREAHALLAAWDGTMHAHRPEPLLYNAWRIGFGRLVAERALGAEAEAFREASTEFQLFVLREGRHWCGEGEDPCRPLLGQALDEAVASLAAARAGAPLRDWRWGEAHEVRFGHVLFQFIPVLRDWFGSRMQTPGDGYTVNRAGLRGSGRAPFENVHGASFRAVYDLADLDASLFITAPGQSGHPMSPNYRDLAPLWLAGGMLTLPPEPGTVAGRLRLVPRLP